MPAETIFFTVDYPETTEPVMTDPKEKYIAALLREREAAPRLGFPERVKEIDAELARHGYLPDGTPKPEDKPAGRAPVGRSAPERATVTRKAAA